MENKLTLRDMISREVIYCASVLISDLRRLAGDASAGTLRETSIDEEELRDLCQREDWETPVETYINNMDRDALICALDEAGVEDDREENGTDLDDNPWYGLSEDGLRIKLTDALEAENDGYADFGRAHDLDPEYDEVYEHWTVTDWLARRLKDKGEITGEVCGLTIWGRCTTGQSISMDGVIQQIYRDLMGIEGKEFIQS